MAASAGKRRSHWSASSHTPHRPTRTQAGSRLCTVSATAGPTSSLSWRLSEQHPLRLLSPNSGTCLVCRKKSVCGWARATLWWAQPLPGIPQSLLPLAARPRSHPGRRPAGLSTCTTALPPIGTASGAKCVGEPRTAPVVLRRSDAVSAQAPGMANRPWCSATPLDQTLPPRYCAHQEEDLVQGSLALCLRA